MEDSERQKLSLFLDILQTMERIQAPYMIIGAFAASIYGSTRITYDIDIVVDLAEEDIEQLVAAYSSPRYYADPEQIRNSIGLGMMFNIIDSQLGEKADLVPITMDKRYRQAFQRRQRREVQLPSSEPFSIWCARAEDVIVGKLMAWAEGRSRKHETDIYEMLVFIFLGADRTLSKDFEEDYIDALAIGLGREVAELWRSIKEAARQEAKRLAESNSESFGGSG